MEPEQRFPCKSEATCQQIFYPDDPFEDIDLEQYVDLSRAGEVVAGFGPCRVGTKAQMYTMAASGFTAYEQPLKAMVRCLSHGKTPDPFRPEESLVYFKETLGPYTAGEGSWNPIAVPGIDSAREVHWLAMIRHPYDTWSSWKRLWSDRVAEELLFDHFRRAYEATLETCRWAEQKGISVVGFDYTLNRSPKETYQALFERIGLAVEPVVENWQDKPYRRRLEENFVFAREPELFVPDGVRDQFGDAEGLHYRSYDEDVPRREEIEEHVLGIYRQIQAETRELDRSTG